MLIDFLRVLRREVDSARKKEGVRETFSFLKRRESALANYFPLLATPNKGLIVWSSPAK